jgi:tRNA (cmo5U34)-methyltransferase
MSTESEAAKAKQIKRDAVFREKLQSVSDFQFDGTVAEVFDDMLGRSVPFYGEIQRMIMEMVPDFVTDGSNIYDLGCSTGTTLLGIDKTLGDQPATLIGIDNSPEMLAKCRAKFDASHPNHELKLIEADLNQGVEIENASVVLMVLTLQFLRPLYRERLMRTIYEGMNEQGCLILVEKVLGENSTFNRLFIDYYYRMKKRHGYSELEISQKREALENVLIPYKLIENRELILNTGFRSWDVFFKWYNFCGMIAVK